jgi:hypothetical protein
MKKNPISPSSAGGAPQKSHCEQDRYRAMETRFEKYTEDMQDKQNALIEQVEDIIKRQKKWLGTFKVTEGERRLAEVYWQEQEAALKTLFKIKESGLSSVGESQAAFVRAMCNSLLSAGEAGLQSNRFALHQEQAVLLYKSLEEKNREFWTLLEDKIKGVQGYAPQIQDLINKQITMMTKQWNNQYQTILDEFAELLNRHRSMK